VSHSVNLCEPGDITVTPVHSGFMIGRALPEIGPGPWWAFITIVTNRDEAIQHARTLTLQAKSRAWFHEGGDMYHPIPLPATPDDTQQI